MSKTYLQITYSQGKPFAAHLYLQRRSDDKSHRTERHGDWLVDLAADGRAIGVEFSTVGTVNLAELNRIVVAAHQPALSIADVMPLEAA